MYFYVNNWVDIFERFFLTDTELMKETENGTNLHQKSTCTKVIPFKKFSSRMRYKTSRKIIFKLIRFLQSSCLDAEFIIA